MAPVTDHIASEWLNGRQASRRIGCSPTALQRAALLGQVRTKIEPGIPPRYHRDDVERIAESRLQAAGA
jgi:hypothetical protein